MKKVLFSGMQPTGKLHLGNYEGALSNWVELQNSGEYETYFCIVDWHSLTIGYEDTGNLSERIYQLTADYIAAGLDPEKSAIFVQSHVKEHSELHLLFSMITPMGWLERVPSYKEKSEKLGLDNYGFLGYPLLQAADILLYKGETVPVGKDQLPHIELTRKVARRFNNLYDNIFPEPEALTTEHPAVPGTDGKKMSKSYGNEISMGDPPDVINAKVMNMFTDPEKISKSDPGHPEKCAVYKLHSIYNPDYEAIYTPCKEGSSEWGCVTCKKKLVEFLSENFKEFREKRKELLNNKGEIERILKKGADKAREKAVQTMDEVQKSMNLFTSGR